MVLNVQISCGLVLSNSTLVARLRKYHSELSAKILQLFMAHLSVSRSTQLQILRTFTLNHAFTASQLALSGHTYPSKKVQETTSHASALHQPLLLRDSYHIHLIITIVPVRLCTSGSPTAIKICHAWTLQGPIRDIQFSQSSVPV